MLKFTYTEIKKALDYIYKNKLEKTNDKTHNEIRSFIRELKLENKKSIRIN